MKNKFIQEVEKRFNDSFNTTTEGFQIAVLKNNKLVFKQDYGVTYNYYDLASLTKIFYTVSALQFLNEFGLLLPDHFVKDYIFEWKNPKTQIKHLLTHTAGLNWWKPFYKKLDLKDSSEQKKQSVYKEIINSKSQLSTKSTYSDLDFILLNKLIESACGMDSNEFSKVIYKLIDCSDLFFHKNNKLKYAKNNYAPTESCPWRLKTLQGEVHDDNTWAMGGVSGHAGLFGSLDAVVKWSQWFYGSLHNDQVSWASPLVIKPYTKRAVAKSTGAWALGYMMPTKGRASCGKHFSANSIGHTGFVGTSFWHDPKNKLSVIVLSNRVHPTRDNNLFVKLRPIIHDVAFEFFVS